MKFHSGRVIVLLSLFDLLYLLVIAVDNDPSKPTYVKTESYNRLFTHWFLYKEFLLSLLCINICLIEGIKIESYNNFFCFFCLICFSIFLLSKQSHCLGILSI